MFLKCWHSFLTLCHKLSVEFTSLAYTIVFYMTPQIKISWGVFQWLCWPWNGTTVPYPVLWIHCTLVCMSCGESNLEPTGLEPFMLGKQINYQTQHLFVNRQFVSFKRPQPCMEGLMPHVHTGFSRSSDITITQEFLYFDCQWCPHFALKGA